MSYFSLTILLLSMLSILSRTSSSYGANYLYHFCANTTIPKNSPYKSSLSSLFSSFSLYANHNVQFYSPSSSSLTSSLSSNAISKIQISLNISDPIYGLHICRSDVTAEVCRECVEEAAKELANRCSRELVAVIWYDECMIRYSNASFFSTVAIRPRVSLLRAENTTKQEQFNRLVNTTMTDLASRASNVTAGANKFGVNQVNISKFQTLYSLVQCTPDLSNTDYNSCLQAAINHLPKCCKGGIAWENWREGTTSNLIDPTLRSGPIAEMMRYIHIGLLCVQQNVTDRPNMTSVLLMLNSNSVALPAPTQPASFLQSNLPSADPYKRVLIPM